MSVAHKNMTVKAMKAFIPREGMKALIIGDNHEWAQGDNGAQAHKNCSSPFSWALYEVHPAVWVDGMCNFRYDRLPEDTNDLPDDDIVKFIGGRK